MKLIDADALINDIEELITEYEEAMRDSEEHPEKYPEDYKTRAMNLIAGLIATKVEVDNAPTIDAEPVVRCKDCRHGEKMKTKLAGRITAVFCHKNKKERFMLENDYCSYGERREP